VEGDERIAIEHRGGKSCCQPSIGKGACLGLGVPGGGKKVYFQE